ncbi:MULTISPECIES: hypothetical protein [unclassified Mesorhizobium]|uniref:hypothetical protein n=1 Tax=unclassified Mesorhizobium TaxID=325217 RepID=UPI001FE0CAC7|nr:MULTISPECIES: hypothetical protein [unclassified Mesorhizobium]
MTKTLQTTNIWLDEIMALPAAGGREDEIHSTRESRGATKSVFKVLARHVDVGQSVKVRDALPKQIQALWPDCSSKTKV